MVSSREFTWAKSPSTTITLAGVNQSKVEPEGTDTSEPMVLAEAIDTCSPVPAEAEAHNKCTIILKSWFAPSCRITMIYDRNDVLS
eukprot:scaffold138993_cov30-Prasinocladus_malaysianus.AAC.1